MPVHPSSDSRCQWRRLLRFLPSPGGAPPCPLQLPAPRTDCPAALPTPLPLPASTLRAEMDRPLNDHHLDSLGLLCALQVGRTHAVALSSASGGMGYPSTSEASAWLQLTPASTCYPAPLQVPGSLADSHAVCDGFREASPAALEASDALLTRLRRRAGLPPVASAAAAATAPDGRYDYAPRLFAPVAQLLRQRDFEAASRHLFARFRRAQGAAA